MTKGDGVKRGVGVEWQPSDYLGRVHADIIFGGGYPASINHEYLLAWRKMIMLDLMYFSR
jgi:hypothetical protein